MSKIGKFKQILLIRPRQVPLLAQRFYQKRKFNYDFYTNKLKIFYSRVLKDVFIVKKCTGRCILRRLERCFSAFWPRFWKFKKTAFFRCVERLGMTTVGMPGHGFTFPVGGIVPVIFSSMVCSHLFIFLTHAQKGL